MKRRAIRLLDQCQHADDRTIDACLFQYGSQEPPTTTSGSYWWARTDLESGRHRPPGTCLCTGTHHRSARCGWCRPRRSEQPTEQPRQQQSVHSHERAANPACAVDTPRTCRSPLVMRRSSVRFRQAAPHVPAGQSPALSESRRCNSDTTPDPVPVSFFAAVHRLSSMVYPYRSIVAADA